MVSYGARYIGYEFRWLIDRLNISVGADHLKFLDEVTNLFDLILVCSRPKSIEEILAEGEDLLENDIAADNAESDGGRRRYHRGFNRDIDFPQGLKRERLLCGSRDSVKE